MSSIINTLKTTTSIKDKKLAYVEEIPYLQNFSSSLLNSLRLWKGRNIREIPSLNFASTLAKRKQNSST
mgnify:FL=1